MKTQTVNISIPDPLLDAADKQAEREHRNRSELFREALRRYLTEKGSLAFSGTFTSVESKRLSEIVDFAEFGKDKIVALSCAFRPQPNKVIDIFSGNSSVVQLIENPPTFRHAGWDLQTLDRAKPMVGEYLQVANGDRKAIRVFRDGQIIAAGDSNFFGHGVNKDPDQGFALNGLAVAEFITNFVNFSLKFSANLDIPPSSLIFKVRILNPAKEKIKLELVRKGNFPFPETAGEIYLDLVDREVLINLDQELKFEQIAYLLLAEFFYFFGRRDDEFWYVNKETKEVNLDFFKEK